MPEEITPTENTTLETGEGTKEKVAETPAQVVREKLSSLRGKKAQASQNLSGISQSGQADLKTLMARLDNLKNTLGVDVSRLREQIEQQWGQAYDVQLEKLQVIEAEIQELEKQL